LVVEVRYCDLCKARENRRRNPGDYRQSGPVDIWENFQKRLACPRFRLGKRSVVENIRGIRIVWGPASCLRIGLRSNHERRNGHGRELGRGARCALS